jgi:hypothetical protein
MKTSGTCSLQRGLESDIRGRTMSPNHVRRNTFHGLIVTGNLQLKSAAIGAQPAAEEKTIP